MPVKSAKKQYKSAPKHKYSKPYLKAYWPYLPMILIIVCGLLLGGVHFNGRPIHSVLSYTIGANNNTLLQATNEQRSINGKTSLKLNQQLMNAAQAKAQDMVDRNYWSHNTPDGQEPWVFIIQAGYKYISIGENLAYGFTSATTTVNGWMNSPSHKENLLNTNFSEVGFGFANSPNFVQTGPETVIVAMYGKPLVEIVHTSVENNTPAATQSATTTSTPAIPTTQQPAPATQQPTNSSNSPQSDTNEKNITKIDFLASGELPWLISAVSLVMIFGTGLLIIKFGHRFIRMVKDGENYIAKHPIVDTIIVAVIMVSYVLSSTVGIIK